MSKYNCEKCHKEYKNKNIYTKHLSECNENIYQLNFIDDKKCIKFIDLFCGIGSFHYSFRKLGWKCVMSCDINKTARLTYKENYGIEPLDDIAFIKPKNIERYDILCAGFPCQSFSNCGKKKGFDDVRGTLFFNIMEFVRYHNPKVIILENVQGLLTHDKGNTFETIKKQIDDAGYIVSYKILKCSDYGIPQMRKRLFIIGIKNDFQIRDKIDDIMDFKEYKTFVSLSTFLGKNFKKEIAYTIRCGGKNSPIDDKHNWDLYVHILSI